MDIEGLGALEAGLERLRRLAEAPDAIARDIGIIVERSTRKAFSNATAPDVVATVEDGKAEEAAGAPWAPLADSTIRRRRNKNKGSIKILRDTATLQRSISSVVTGGAVTVGSGVEYGKWHQGGTRQMPARPFLGYNDEDVETFWKVVARHLEAAAG